MSRVGRAVLVDSVVSITVVSNDDGFVASFVSSRNHLVHTLVNRLDSLFDSLVNTGVTHHVAIGKVHHDEVELILLDGSNEFVLHLESRHFGLEVVSSHLGRSHEDAFLAFVRSFASTVEEEGNVCILFGFGRVQLFQSLRSQVFAERVLHVLFGEEDVNTRERSIVRRHAVVLQAGNGVHTFFGHILLRQHHGKFLGAVVAVVEENNHVAFLDASVDVGIYQRFHEFVGVLVLFRVRVVAALYASHHVGYLTALAFNQLVVSHLHTVPTLVAVHGIEAAHDAGNVCTVGIANALQTFDKALTALRVGVAAVHEAVNVSVFSHAIFLGNFDEFEQVVERRVYTTG